jgi:hypothetical protein
MEEGSVHRQRVNGIACGVEGDDGDSKDGDDGSGNDEFSSGEAMCAQSMPPVGGA